MRVFVAGATGSWGDGSCRSWWPGGHRVTVTTTSPGKLGMLEQLGADAVVMEATDVPHVVAQRWRWR